MRIAGSCGIELAFVKNQTGVFVRESCRIPILVKAFNVKEITVTL